MTEIQAGDAAIAISRMARRIAFLEEQVATLRARAEKAEALAREHGQKRHEYGMWIARLEQQPSSHQDPIETCRSFGCRRTRYELEARHD